MNDLKRKTALLIVAIVLLISTLLYMTFAWYTKMTSMSGLEFKTAKWDISANSQIESFVVNVFEYDTIGPQDEKIAAPGAWGTIPLKVTSTKSNSDVSFKVTIDKSSMSKEFQDRLYFYCYTGTETAEDAIIADTTHLVELRAEADGDKPKTTYDSTVPFGEEASATIYWHWIYDYDELLRKTDEELLAVAQIFDALIAQNLANKDVFNTSDAVMNNVILKATSETPSTQYYSYDPNNYKPYNKNDWATADPKPILFTENDGVYSQALIPSGTTEIGDGFYVRDPYVLYTANVAPTDDTVLYVQNGEEYVEMPFHYDNQVFLKADGTYFALTAAQINALKQYRAKEATKPDSTLKNSYQFYYDLYLMIDKARTDFDNFDTNAGLNPKLYAAQMAANLVLTGEQVQPVKNK